VIAPHRPPEIEVLIGAVPPVMMIHLPDRKAGARAVKTWETSTTHPGPLDGPLPEGIPSRLVHNNNGPSCSHAGSGLRRPRPRCVVLLHGFPELAYSWRKIMVPLASAGFHVIAPDQRGYGRTTGWDTAR
jgi:pimeloyl-ACP methyl ester carboxylesterase